MRLTLLALEAATDMCSCAVLRDGEIFARQELAPRRHAERILPMMDEVLAQAGIGKRELDAVAVGRGPGSFTGLRIAIGVAQAIGLGLDIPVIPVSTLATIAQGVAGNRVAAALDARMGEVYWGCFARDAAGLVVPLGEEQVLPPEQVSLPEAGPWTGVGEGWLAYREALPTVANMPPKPDYPLAQNSLPLAARLWEQGQAVPPEQAQPIYLRNQVVRNARNPAKST